MNTQVYMNIYIHVNMCSVCVLARCPAYKNSLNKIAYIVFSKTPGSIESTLCTLKKKKELLLNKNIIKGCLFLLANTSQSRGSGLDFNHYSCLELGIKNGSARH